MVGQPLSRRGLNRATLDRQLLLRRSPLPVIDAVEHLVGLQAQTPQSWYVGLWSRVAGFCPEQAARPLADRALVRIALMRSTIHLVSAADAIELRPLTQPVSDRDLTRSSTHTAPLRGVDTAALTAAGRELLARGPLTNKQLGADLGERWPDVPPASLVHAIRSQLPLVQVPPRGLWGRSGPIAHTTVETWLGRDLAPRPSLDRMLLRFLAAFGPASVRDAQTWCGLTRLAEVFDRLRPDLVVLRDGSGRELFDLPDAPRPDEDVPAPPRFLYDFDNLLLSHADRTRVISDDQPRQRHPGAGGTPQLVLVDGFTAGAWRVERKGDAATLAVRPHRPLATRDTAAVEEEGGRLLEFLAADAATRNVEVHHPPG